MSYSIVADEDEDKEEEEEEEEEEVEVEEGFAVAEDEEVEPTVANETADLVNRSTNSFPTARIKCSNFFFTSASARTLGN